MAKCKRCHRGERKESFDFCDSCWEAQIKYELRRPILIDCNGDEEICKCGLHRGRRFFQKKLYQEVS